MLKHPAGSLLTTVRCDAQASIGDVKKFESQLRTELYALEKANIHSIMFSVRHPTTMLISRMGRLQANVSLF